VTENVSFEFPMEYVEVYAPREGFVLPRDGKILWAPVAELEPKFRCGGIKRDYTKLTNLYTIHICAMKNF
jgi:hypothetical protein